MCVGGGGGGEILQRITNRADVWKLNVGHTALEERKCGSGTLDTHHWQSGRAEAELQTVIPGRAGIQQQNFGHTPLIERRFCLC